jgi:cyclic pyranopterin phosphate synthase
MQDRFGRTIDYLRISVTDRCNLNCYYCLPDRNAELLPRSELLSFEEIRDFTALAAGLGIRKVRLTGGEPLVRADILALVGMLSRIEGVEDLSMTTNGQLLDLFARPLFEAGLNRLNVSLDTINPDRYREVTGGGRLERTLSGILSAGRAGFERIKLNCVVEKSRNEMDAREVARFAMENGFEVRYIRRMNLAEGEFWVVDGGSGGKCEQCSRLRLSCDGQVRPCLFSDVGYPVRKLGMREALMQALRHKPESGQSCRTITFRRIGG